MTEPRDPVLLRQAGAGSRFQQPLCPPLGGRSGEAGGRRARSGQRRAGLPRCMGGNAVCAAGPALGGVVAMEVAAPVWAARAVGEVLLSTIRAALSIWPSAPGTGSGRVGAGDELERAPKPPGLWDAVEAQVESAFADFFDGDYPRSGAMGVSAGVTGGRSRPRGKGRTS